MRRLGSGVTAVRVERLRPGTGDRPQFSIVVPLAAGDDVPATLLAALPADMEIIAVRGGTRAAGLNAGAAAARGRFLWFVHADTRLAAGAIEALHRAVARDPDALLFFDLRFDGPAVMGVNVAGAQLRSRLLRLPFGDQALCLGADLFGRLGGYPAVERGEDHLMVWRAHRAGVPVRPVGAAVTTSSRRYVAKGWARTTARHVGLTVTQALPEFLALLRGR